MRQYTNRYTNNDRSDDRNRDNDIVWGPECTDLDYEWMYLEAVPVDEWPQQRTKAGYDRKAGLAECQRYRALIRSKCGIEPVGAALLIASMPSDDGSYHELVVEFEKQNPVAAAYAHHVEAHLPESWEDTKPEPFEGFDADATDR